MLHRILSAASSLALVSVLALWAGGAHAQAVVQFELPEQPLADSLRAVARQTNTNVMFDRKLVRGRTAPALKVQGTLDDVLAKLLLGTGIRHEFVNEKTVTLIPADGSKASTPTARASEDGSMRLTQADSAATTGAGVQTSSSEAENAGQPQKSPDADRQEIVVTATKREERLQDVPMSVTVITGQDIERRSLVGMEDYLRSIPGVAQIDQGALSNAIIIRGITTSPEFENFNSAATVSIYFDETSITGASGPGAGAIDVRPVDIERIEVLRGPQGTAFGDGSLGGMLRIIPAKPRLDSFGAKLAASYSDTGALGSDNSMFQGMVNLPVVQDRLALRAVGYRFDESGMYRNVAGNDPTLLTVANNFGVASFLSGFLQDDVGRMVSTGGRLSALWKPTDRLDILLSYLTQTIEQDGSPIADMGKYDQTHTPIAPAGRRRGELGDVNDTDVELANLTVNYDLSWAGLTSTVSRVNGGSVNSSAIIWALLFPNSTTIDSDFDALSIETRVASKLQGRLQYLAGLFYQKVDSDVVQTFDWVGSPATSPVGTNPMLLFRDQRELSQRAVFGEVSFDLTSRLEASAGGRYFKYDKQQAILQEGGFVGTAIGAGVRDRLRSDEDGTTFKANLSYKPSERSQLYASWSEGFRLGRPQSTAVLRFRCDRDGDGFIDTTSTSIDDIATIESDTLQNFELGGKFNLFDNRMALSAAAYHIDWKGLPAFAAAVASSACPVGFTTNAGSATSDGVEFQASLRITRGFKIDFGAGFTDAELAEDAPGLGVKGARLPGSPRSNANLSIEHDFELAGHSAYARADSFYTGKVYGNLQETPATAAGDYIRLDLRTGMSIGALSVELFVRNVTDEDAFTWRRTADLGNDSFGYRLRPRTVGIQLGYTFE